MADVAKLLVECQVALKLSQKELGALVRRDRRTIQRWQEKGCDALLPAEAEALAGALRPIRPDLADQVLALGGKSALVGQSAPTTPVTPAVIDAILAAAARAGNTSTVAIEAAVAAAFDEAARAGVEAAAVVAAMRAR
jgi:hypothetical protein